MVASIAFPDRSNWSISPEIRWSVSCGIGGQLKPKSGGQFQRNLQHTTQKLWEDLTKPNVMGVIGFASYSLKNNGANIRQVKNRIEQLKRQEARQPIDKIINDVRIFENREVNRLQVIFNEKPSEEIRKQLKANGFRWSPSQGAWQRHISNYAYHSAKEIAEKLNKRVD